jgi:hypothetical protein
MSIDEIERLALDALFERQLLRHQCTVVNTAGMRLIECGPAAMPVLEKVIGEHLVPAGSDLYAYENHFLGKHYVLGAYLFIGGKVDPQQVIDFVEALPTELICDVVSSFLIVYRPMNDGYNFGAPPPEPLKHFVEGLANSPSEKISTAARRVLGIQSREEKRWGRSDLH